MPLKLPQPDSMLLLSQDPDLIYAAPLEPVIVQVPPLSFIMIDGSGDPDTGREYRPAATALRELDGQLRRELERAGLAATLPPMPLETLWLGTAGVDHSTGAARTTPNWRWTMMLRQPASVTRELLDLAVQRCRPAHPWLPLETVRLEILDEGQCLQVMHTGPYEERGMAILKLRAAVRDLGLVRRGHRHELCLTDPFQPPPANARLLIRQPIARSAFGGLKLRAAPGRPSHSVAGI